MGAVAHAGPDLERLAELDARRQAELGVPDPVARAPLGRRAAASLDDANLAGGQELAVAAADGDHPDEPARPRAHLVGDPGTPVRGREQELALGGDGIALDRHLDRLDVVVRFHRVVEPDPYRHRRRLLREDRHVEVDAVLAVAPGLGGRRRGNSQTPEHGAAGHPERVAPVSRSHFKAYRAVVQEQDHVDLAPLGIFVSPGTTAKPVRQKHGAKDCRALARWAAAGCPTPGSSWTRR